MALTFPSGPTPGQIYVGPNNITYTWDNTLQVWTGSSPGAGGLTAASPAQAAAGTLNTVASTPQTAVPKDASGMTGAALMPGGTDAERAAIATPSGGMFRYNTTLSPDSMEFYDSTQSSWVALATLPQLQGVSLDAYSNFSANNGGFTDVATSPAFTIRNGVIVPAGYTNFIVYSSLAFKAGYNTLVSAVSPFNAVHQNGVQIAYQAVAFGNLANIEATQISASVFQTATSAVGVSNTFTQRVNKQGAAPGPVIPLDSSLLVLAWTI